ncbi:hypothetical protein GCM10010517_21130 [Streptosporangium fragile]|uniref:Uncharacterized protein n=1 Tax=Streptosporangium fragile TaxID=46186 RepID=A0ABP6IAK0_9ACTN
MAPPLPEESGLPPPPAEVDDGRAPAVPDGPTVMGTRFPRPVSPAALSPKLMVMVPDAREPPVRIG